MSGETDDEDDDLWFDGNYFSDGEEDEVGASADHRLLLWSSSTCATSQDDYDLRNAMQRLSRCRRHLDDEGDNIDATVKDYQERTRLVQVLMGSMALCRGKRGEQLREAGAIDALLLTLMEIKSSLRKSAPTTFAIPSPDQCSTTTDSMIVLATVCFGAIRDLACGSAENRSAVRTFSSSNDNDMRGLELVANYLALYSSVSWDTVVSNEQLLSLLINIIGALRNLTHSTADNCIELHNAGVTCLLSRRLHDCGGRLPDSSTRWRGAAFRAGGTLINMAEKCTDCATYCARDPALIRILIECWGGTCISCAQKQAPILHLGLAAILKAAKSELLGEEYEQSWNVILTREMERKRVAQRKEEERKDRLKVLDKR